jgi:hypothetical protein
LMNVMHFILDECDKMLESLGTFLSISSMYTVFCSYLHVYDTCKCRFC